MSKPQLRLCLNGDLLRWSSHHRQWVVVGWIQNGQFIQLFAYSGDF